MDLRMPGTLPDWIRRSLPYLFLTGLCVLPYAHTLSGPLIWDDHLLITDNESIRDIGRVSHLFSLSYWINDNPGTPGQYRPLRAAFFAVGYALWGENPVGYRAANLIVFLLDTFLVYKVGRGILGNSTAALLAGVFFAIHPAHTETVAWVKNYTELMACCLTLTGVWAYTNGWQRRGAMGRCVSILVTPMAFLAKETGLVYPLLLLAWEGMRGGMRGLPRRLLNVVPHLVMLVLYIVFLLMVLGRRVTHIEPPSLDFLQRVCVVFRSIWFYLKDLFFPVGLNAEPVLDKSASLLDPVVWGGALASLGVVWLAWRLKDAEKGGSYSLVWIVVCLLPIVNIHYITGRPLADQRVFLASVGACWLAGRAASLALKAPLKSVNRSDWMAAACTSIGVIVVGAAVATYTRNWVWTDPVLLYEDTVTKSPNAERAYYNLGNIYKERGEWDKAVQAYHRAIAISPDNEGTRNNLGLVFFYKGDYEKAEQEFLIALKIKPLLTATLMNLSLLYMEMERLELATEYLQKAVVTNPEKPEPHYHLGRAFLKLGRLHEAERELRTVISLAPRHTEARVQLAQLQLRLKEPREEALAQLEQALQERPEDYAALVLSGNLLAANGQVQLALERYNKAIAADRRDPWAYVQKGLLLESLGDVEGAEAAYREAVSVDPAHGLGNLRLGAFLLRSQRVEEASRYLQRALVAEPREPEAHLQMARLSLEYPDRIPQAMSHLRNALSLAPDHPNRGEILGLIQSLEEVIQSQGLVEPGR